MGLQTRVATTCLAAAAIAGCAWTPARYEAKRLKMDDTETCAHWQEWDRTQKEPYLSMAASEIERRGLTRERCYQLFAERSAARQQVIRDVAGAAVVVTAVVAAAYYSQQNRPAYAPSGGVDHEWAWDQFRGPTGLVWACRGVQTGQFSDQQLCRSAPFIDRWPGY